MGTWEPYVTTSSRPIAGELVVCRDATDRDVLVLLPPSYGAAARRYPVLYAHDGQNLFDEATSYSGEWEIDESMAALAAEGLEAIVVGIPNGGPARGSEYSPWAQPDGGPGGADGYLDLVLGTIRPLVDGSFATDRGPARTGILGSSLGGLVSLYAFFRYPGTFGYAGVLSPAFRWSGEAVFDFVAAAPLVEGRIWMDVGDNESPELPELRAAYVDDFDRMCALLGDKGYGPERLHSRLEPGGSHHESAWARRFPDAMRFFLAPTA